MFDGFTAHRFDSAGVEIAYWTGGSGPPLLLIHGYPQTHVMWHKIAPALAARFTVVAPDLRGYGDSAKPAGDADHGNYSKRTMAADLVGLMASLGHAASSSPGTTAAGASPTAWRSTIPLLSAASPSSTSSRPRRCTTRPTGSSPTPISTGSC